MATIHFILQGKGGVGKSMIASLLYQTMQEQDQNVFAYDTDPVNSTLGAYKEFTVHRIELMKHGDIDPRQFDALFQGLMEAPDGSHVIVDNGASSFVALGTYLKENEVLPVLQEAGHKVYFHSVITGGQAISDTLNGLANLLQSFPDASIIVWLNPYFGEIALQGKSFEQMKIYQEYSSRISHLISLPHVPPATLGKDLEELFAKRYSFKAGIADSTASIAVKSRLRLFWQTTSELIVNAFSEDIVISSAKANDNEAEAESTNDDMPEEESNE